MFNNSLEKNRYSLRKLSVGLASVLIGISFIEANGQTAKADTVDGGNTAAISTKVEKTANASAANKGTTASNGSLGVASSASAGQESVKENGSQNYSVNDSAETTAAKTEAVKGTITAAKATLDAENDDAVKANISALTANASDEAAKTTTTDAKTVANSSNVTTSNAKQNSAEDTTKIATSGSLQSDAKTVTNQSKQATQANKDMQTLDANKNSKPLDSKIFAANLTDAQKQYVWNDTSDAAMIARGYHKTAVGWSNVDAGDNVSGNQITAIAKKSNIDLHPVFSSADLNTKINEETVNSDAYWSSNINTTIDKKDLKENANILIGDTIISYSDLRQIPVGPEQTGDEARSISINGQKIGTITVASGINNVYYFLHVTASNDYLKDAADDLNINLRIDDDVQQFYDIRNLKGLNKNNNIESQIITPNNDSSHVYNRVLYISASSTGSRTYSAQNSDSVDLGAIRWGGQVNGARWSTDSYTLDHPNQELHSVIKFQSTISDSPLKEPNNSTVQVYTDVGLVSGYNVTYLNGVVHWLPNAIQKENNDLSAADLYNLSKTDNGHAKFIYSMQKDGSILFAYDFNSKNFKLTQSDIENTVKASRQYLFADSDSEREKMLNDTLNAYKANGYYPFSGHILYFPFGYDSSKPLNVTATVLTPGSVNAGKTTVNGYDPTGGKNINTSMYRTYNVQYKDAVTGKIISNDAISTKTGANVDYKAQTSDSYMLAPGQNNEIKFTVPKDEKTTPDPIVINVLGKEDYERDRTYKVVIQKPDHKGGTIDSTYATYTFKMHRDITGRDSNGKVTFSNWQYTSDDGGVYTYNLTDDTWNMDLGFGHAISVDYLNLGSAEFMPKDSDFEVPGYTAKSDIAIDGIDLAHFLDGLPASNAKDKIDITNDGKLALHTAGYANPDKLLPDTTFYIKYTVNNQSITYKIVDDDVKDAQGNPTQIGKDIVLTGVTDQTVNTGLKLPDHYYLANGSTMPPAYTFGAVNTPVLIHLKHVRDAVKDDKYLKNTSVRTIIFDFPAGYGDPETITQTIGWTRTGTYDEVTAAAKGLDEAEKEGNYTDWVFTSDPAATKVTVTVNGKDNAGLASKYQAYDQQAYTKDNNDIEFAVIPIPKIPGYKATFTHDSANPAMLLVSFMALPNTSDATKDDNTEINNPTKPVDPSDDTKPAINVPVTPSDPKDTVPKSPIAAPSVPVEVKDTQDITFDEPVEAPAVQAADLAWHIKDDAKVATYTVANAAHILSLPRFTGYTLRLVKRDAARDAISFVYVNPNKTLKYIFNIKLANGKYILTIGKVTEDGIIQLEKVTFSDYNQLIQLIAKAVNR